MLGKKRSASVFTPAAPASPAPNPEEKHTEKAVEAIAEPAALTAILSEEAPPAEGKPVLTGRAHSLFFTPEDDSREFPDVCREVQGYIAANYSTLMTGESDSREQIKRYAAKYVQDKRIAVKGMTIINKQIAEDLKNNWQEFKKTLRNLEDILKSMKIEVSRFSSSWNVLLPIIYFMYYNPDYANNLDGIRAYLIRAVLFTYFQSGTTSKLQQMKSSINDNDYEITVDMLEQMTDLRVTDGKIDDIINLLWYIKFVTLLSNGI